MYSFSFNDFVEDALNMLKRGESEQQVMDWISDGRVLESYRQEILDKAKAQLAKENKAGDLGSKVIAEADAAIAETDRLLGGK